MQAGSTVTPTPGHANLAKPKLNDSGVHAGSCRTPERKPPGVRRWAHSALVQAAAWYAEPTAVSMQGWTTSRVPPEQALASRSRRTGAL
ncbi:hypothetical protein SATRM34S_00446 [Streptomyces atroolivaceus]